MAEKERNFVSWRLDKLSDTERAKINDWLDGQGNIQKSITNVVLHMIERFGHDDILDYEIQKTLYGESTSSVSVKPSVTPVTQESKPESVETAVFEEDVVDLKPNDSKAEEIELNEEDDWLSDVNPNDL